MITSPHEVLIEGAPGSPAGVGQELATAFSDFIAASSRLEWSYRDLQAEVAQLTHALQERNRALSESLSENRALSHRFERILENVPCGVLVVDDRNTVQLANSEAARLLAGSSSHGSVRSATLKPSLQQELQLPNSVADCHEHELSVNAAGNTLWLAVRRVQLPDGSANRGRTEFVLTLRDITAHKQMEMEREQDREAVALAQVSALLAHEIRNPLASLELIAGLLSGEPERREEWFPHLQAGIRLLSGTVNNVLTLHSSTPQLLERVDVATETKLAVEFMQPIARQAEVSLTFREEEPIKSVGLSEELEDGPWIQGNRGALHQILMNLCTNALRHTPEGGRVEVRWQARKRAKGAPLQIEVVDTGCGIPAEHLPRLLQLGFSGSGATTGLGLAVCDRLLRQLGGSLAVHSRVGHGSTFIVKLVQA